MAGPGPADDVIQPFQVDALDAHGRLVRLGAAVDRILSQHAYPEPVSILLGEALAMTAALAGALKFEGTFSTQIQGDGPVRLLIADFSTDGAMRAYAGYDADAVAARAPASRPGAIGDAGLFGAGHMAFTIDQGGDVDRYQGLVGLEGATLADCAQAYLTRSEQLRADIRCASVRWPEPEGGACWRAGCLLVQQVPAGDGRADDDGVRAANWTETLALVGRLKRVDLADPLAVPPALIAPLFPGRDIRLYRARPLRFECRCTAARAARVLDALGPDERADLVVDGRIEVTCDYCNTRYLFDPDGKLIGDA